jgi:hypothetical protein
MRTDPVEHAQAAIDFHATLGKDVSYHPAIWHSYKVGQLLIADLDRLCAQRDLSMADVHLLGVARIDRPEPLRATDLAQTLNVSNAVLSARLKRLEGRGCWSAPRVRATAAPRWSASRPRAQSCSTRRPLP